MDWTTVAPILLDVFSQLAADPIENVPAFQAQWGDRSGANRMMSPDYQHALTLKVTRCVYSGQDEQRFTFDPDAIDPVSGLQGLNVATMCGLRDVTLQLRSECSQADNSLWAVGVLDRIQTRIQFNRYWNRLRDEANCAFYDWEAIVDHGTPRNGRMLQVATMDMHLYVAVNERDPVPFNWIEKVQLTTNFGIPQDVADQQVPT